MKYAAGLLALCLFTFSADAGNGAIRRMKQPIPGEYIVRLPDSVAPAAVPKIAAALAKAVNGTVDYVYTNSIRGFSVQVPESGAQLLAIDALVDYVEEAAEVPLWQSALWHVDRVDQVYLPLDGYATYVTPNSPVYAYVVDTGVRASHIEFHTSSSNTTSRVLPGRNFWDISRIAPRPIHALARRGRMTRPIPANSTIDIVSGEVTEQRWPPSSQAAHSEW